MPNSTGKVVTCLGVHSLKHSLKPALCVQVTLEELQLGRSLLHRQAEAAIKEADAQIRLNKGQYNHVGRLLVHVKVMCYIQALKQKWLHSLLLQGTQLANLHCTPLLLS